MYDTYLQAFFCSQPGSFTGLRVIVARSVRFHTLRIFYSHLHTITCSHMWVICKLSLPTDSFSLFLMSTLPSIFHSNYFITNMSVNTRSTIFIIFSASKSIWPTYISWLSRRVIVLFTSFVRSHTTHKHRQNCFWCSTTEISSTWSWYLQNSQSRARPFAERWLFIPPLQGVGYSFFIKPFSAHNRWI